jgi:hypothetical protein
MTQLEPFLAAFHRLDPIYGQEILRGGERERGWRQVHSSLKIYQEKTDILHFGSAPTKATDEKLSKYDIE